jgi:signal transduction histidine kinase
VTRLARAQFLAALSHELRTPLNSILGFTHVLLSELDGPLTTAQREDLAAIESAGTYLTALVREVLDTSAEETGELELFGPVDLGAVATDAARLFDAQARKSGMELVVQAHPGAPRPFGSRRAVRQVLLNLLGNAIKHGGSGSIRIDTSAQDGVATLSVTGPSRSVLAQGDAPFGAFERGPDAHVRGEAGQGWGLGLAIASELAARMAGAIEMKSQLVGGRPETTFSLLLPLAPGNRLGPDPSETSMPTRTHFVAAMSHELRAPLGSIAGFASLLEEELDGPLTAAQRLSVSSIRRSAESLVASLTDILDMARADVGRIELWRARTSPAAILDDALAGAQRLVESRDPPCAVSSDRTGVAELEPADLDARRVLQATLGLVRHALRTGAPTTLELSARESSSRDARSVRFEVRDPGRHMAAHEAEAAFDAFGSLVDPSGRRIFGMGLTLALARTLARMHGGDAWCETAGGTTWVLSVPMGTSAVPTVPV